MEQTEAIKQEVHRIIAMIGYVCAEPTEVRSLGERVGISLYLNSPRDLIGEKGQTLAAFQHVVRLCVAKKISPTTTIDVDINNYKKQREEFLQEFAREVGEKVRFMRKPLELEPMSPFDRRVIHTTLSAYSDLATESKGEGMDRHIVVRPYP